MKCPTFSMFVLAPIFFAGAAIAATTPAEQSRTSKTQSEVDAQSARDSANGSMTNTNLTGDVGTDTSELTTGTTSGTSSGAIVEKSSGQATDQIDKKKKAKKKKHKPTTQESNSEI